MTMKIKVRDILIISAILLGLVVLTFAFSCEDKPVALKYSNMPWKVYKGMTFYDTSDFRKRNERMWMYDGDNFVLIKGLYVERIHWDEDGEGVTIIDCNFAMPEPNEPEGLKL